ncbi:MAG: glutamine N5-methyltransferase [Candidatus Saccharibacteria bacterium]|nr:glutamine N5-methyltransferase [Candidatus Saccharibacteria bacterium]
MTTSYWLRTATNFLQSKGMTTARLDALVLLEDVMQINRAQLLAEPDMEMRDGVVHHLQELLGRRGRHEPLSYIRGRSEFYGRNFVIKPGVLTPRPESETMIDLLKGLYPDRFTKNVSDFSGTNQPNKLWIADVGAGSGALGITAVLELQNASCDLLELDPAALKIAEMNVDLLTSHAYARQSDLLSGAGHDYEVLLCNLPYVPDGYQINKAAGFEPPIALFGGEDGLDLFRKLFAQVAKAQNKPLYIMSEALPQSHGALLGLAAAAGYRERQKQDFIQVFERAT